MIFDSVRELERLYEEGEAPGPGELEGEFYVVAPVFPWLSLELLRHRKATDASGEGDNVLLDGVRFGRFRLEDEGDSLLINYDRPENNVIMKGVVDRIRRLRDGRIFGKLYYRVFGAEVFLMFFEMRKREEY